MNYGYLALLCTGLTACVTPAQTPTPPATSLANVTMDQTAGCLEGDIEQFGRYLGDWNIQDWQLAPDGASWIEQQGARWNFTCLGNGVAVQDFWMPNAGGVGTNLRVYNSATENWDITWAVTGQTGIAHIGAKQDENGNIVMHYISPRQNPERRITFFPPDETGWNWSLEVSTDKGATWREVYKIKATRR